MTIHRNDTAPTPESDEQYVRDVIDSAMSGTRPPLDLSGTALARGRRLRTRRRLVLASTAVAASVLVAVVAPLVDDGGGATARDGSDLVATQPPAPLPDVARGWWDMPATEMVATVEAILPDGVTVTAPGPLEADTAEGGPAHGWIAPQLGSTTGPGGLNVILSPGPAPDLGQIGMDVGISCNEEFSGRTQCVQIRDDSGTVIGRRLTNRWGGTVVREVVLRRNSGTVQAASANTLDSKWSADSPLSADHPPLTLDQLEDLARNDAWVSHEP